jgi:hypothetical protein
VNKLIAALALVFVVCSCRAKEGPGSGGLASVDGPSSVGVARVAEPVSQQLSVATDAGAGVSAETPAAISLGGAVAPLPRLIVRTAELRVTVADTSKAVAEATKSVEAVGGYVAGSRVWREGELLRARLTLRVPADKLTPALAQLRALAKRVENETISSEDVSAEYVDISARVRNLEATEEELRQLLVVARQHSRRATDVLEVHAQLSRIRGEIEQARGRMRYLSETAAMSSVNLEVIPDAIAQPVVEPGWQPLVVAREAVRALIAFLQVAANAAIWVVIYVVPLVGMLMLIALLAWKAFRRVSGRNAVSTEDASA